MQYLRAESATGAVAALAEHGDDAKVLSGGQSLVPMMSAGFLAPEVLVDVNGCTELAGVAVDGAFVRIGALTRHAALLDGSPDVRAAAPLLREAAPLIGHGPIRNRGTFGGSLAHADPSGEWPAVAVALGAEIDLRGPAATRTVRATDFFLGPLMADLAPDELITEIRVPAAAPATGAAVEELVYRHGDYAVVGVAAQVTVNGDDGIDAVHLSLFGVDATPIRATAAEAILCERGLAGLDEAAAIAADGANPGSDATASAQYRRAMIAVYVRRAVRRAAARGRAVSGADA
jgi:carbon-monoxide dehydrogenase medium subunit